jgi:serine/threonine protein kinase
MSGLEASRCYSLFAGGSDSTFGVGPGVKPGALTDFYQRAYMSLKSQRTILAPILYSVSHTDPAKFADEASRTGVEIVAGVLGRILGAPLGNVFDEATEHLRNIRAMLSNPELDTTVEKCGTKVMIALLTFVRFETRFTASNQKPQPTVAAPARASTAAVPKLDLDICRICDQSIPMELFETHVQSCLAAYQSVTRLTELDESLRALIARIRTEFLSVDWPGVRATALEESFPMLHLLFLLKRAADTDPREIEGCNDLGWILRAVRNVGEVIKDVSIFNEARRLVSEKSRRSVVLTNAASVLGRTRVSGSASVHFEEPSITDFVFVKRVSNGAYARVFLARKKQTGDLFAIKVLPKKAVRQKNEMKQVMTERDILLQLNNPHIVNFYYSIIGNSNLYLVMEYLPGGDLFSLLHSLGSLDEASARYYVVQVIRALGYLHSRGIIHRDLKPDNILVSAAGAIKLTDFGLSYLAAVDRQSLDPSLVEPESVIGTPDYIAPEILLYQKHTNTVDFWSLGVILYELLAGTPPFHGATEHETHLNILKGAVDMNEIPEEITDDAVDFIEKLLVDDPAGRIGANGIDEMFAHPWLAGSVQTEPPFVPELGNEDDTDYFAQRAADAEDDSDIVADMACAGTVVEDDDDSAMKSFVRTALVKLTERNDEVVDRIKKHSSARGISRDAESAADEE